MFTVALVVSAVVGLAVGSFLNVVVHRVPMRVSVVRPRSQCPGCQMPVAPRDNVPVVSFLLLRGRCRSCAEPISPRYPVIEALTAALFVGVTLRLGLDLSVLAYWLFAAALVAVAAIDLEHHIVPNRVVYPTLAVAVPLLVLAAVVDHSPAALLRAAIGGAAAFVALLVIHLVQPRGMGFGDVRLAGVIGVFLGWLGLGLVALGLFVGFLLAAAAGIALMAAGRAGRRSQVPFAPFLAAGAMTSFLWGAPLVRMWLGVGA
ncbi:MAG: prepilin peptidase [Acidimicrobiales bacterium]